MRFLIAGALCLALGLAFTGPAWADKGKLEARLDKGGKVYFVPKPGGKALYWGPNAKEARPLKDGERVYIIPKAHKARR